MSNSIKNNAFFFNSIFLLVIPIAISAFTHLWNLDGFPSVYRDEDHYMRKAMHILSGLGLQEGPEDLISVRSQPYDHPYFGPLFLAAVLGLIGYPDVLNPSYDTHSVEMLYVIPRVLMGLLAVLDTFLIYKIAEHRYNRTVAFIASILFAVMPMTWLLRRIALEPIQLPLLLSSLFFAIYYTRDSIENTTLGNSKKRKNILLILLSGTFLGLAIFTKIPVFTMIPLIAFLIIRNNNSSSKINKRHIGIWFVPIILIPLIWPAYAISIGQFDKWLDGVFWQATGRIDSPLWKAMGVFFVIDPVLLLLGIAGLVFASIKRDYVLLLWVIPFLIFLQVIGYVSYWFFIPILPALCIAAAIFITDLSQKISKKEVFQRVVSFTVITVIGIFGLVISTMLLSMNLTSYHFGVVAFIAKQVEAFVDNGNDNDKNNGNNNKLTILGNNFWLWIPKYVIDKNDPNDYKNFYEQGKIKTEKVLFVAGENFEKDMVRGNRTKGNVAGLKALYNNLHILTTMEEKMKNSAEVYGIIDLDPKGIKKVQIRANY